MEFDLLIRRCREAWLLVLVCAWVITACDGIQEDMVFDDLASQSEIALTKQSLKAVANQSLLVNISLGNTPTANRVVSIETEPQKGKALFLESGVILYQPNQDFTSGTDQFVYKVENNSGISETGEVEIVYVENVTDLECSDVSSLFQIIKLDPNTSIDFEILPGLKACDTEIAPDWIHELSGPYFGELERQGNTGSYTPKTDYQGLDLFAFYIQNPEQTIFYLGLIELHVGDIDSLDFEYCRNEVNDFEVVLTVEDAMRVEKDLIGINGLCEDQVTSIEIVSQTGEVGEAVVDNQVFYYEGNGQTGVDSVVYKVCFIDETCSEATIILSIQDSTLLGGDSCVFALPEIILEMNSSGRLELEFGSKFSEDCKELIDWSTFVLAEEPSHGEVGFDGKLVIYEVYDSFTEEDFFYLNYCLFSDECFTVKVKVKQERNEVACAPPVETIIKIDSSHYDANGSIAVVYNPIATLDSMCQGAYKVEITKRPDVGLVNVTNDQEIIFEADSAFNGRVKIIYLFCSDDGTCVERYLYIESESSESCQISLKNDLFSIERDSTGGVYGEFSLDFIAEGNCSDILDLSTFEIIQNVQHGGIQVDDFLKFSYSSSDSISEDYFSFRICTYNAECFDFTIFLKVEGSVTCLALPQAQDDEFRFENMQDSATADTYTYILEVLENDFSCSEITELEYLGGSQVAEIGLGSSQGRKFFTYKVPKEYVGQETIDYKFCDSSGTCREAKAVVKIE